MAGEVLFGEIVETSNNVADTDNGDLAKKLVQAAALSPGFFRHQQIGEPDLTIEEKRNIAKDLLVDKPHVFLQRYGQHLSEDHLAYFDDLRDVNYEVDFYLKEARLQQCRFVKDHVVRNRRYRAMQQMISAGHEHFSEAEMKRRNPLLHQQLIGRFLSEEERTEAERPDSSNCSLANIIMEHIDITAERELKQRLKNQEEEEEFDTDSEEDEEEIEENSNRAEDQVVLRREFVRSAYHSFLSGKDAGIDYVRIDSDASLDDLLTEAREAEERYFDDRDEPDE